MLEACPSFADDWRGFCADWKKEKGDPPYYLVLGDLARHLIDQYKSGQIDEFDAVFRVVERWHCEGEFYVREAATIGLLEGIQNVSGNTGLDPEVFVKWFGPESKKWWVKLNRFWDGDHTALSDDT